jgi:hypothetical protein
MVRNAFEGSWEELLRRADEFAGRRVRLTILDDAKSQPTTAPTLDRLLARYVGAFSSPRPTNNAQRVEEIWAEGVLQKHRKQQEPRS